METPLATEVPENAITLKEKGNECVKSGNYKEAALYYTQAIKHDPNNYSLYSNRSLAYLRLKHYYLSLQDANETIELEPLWAKGFFRRAEVEAAAGLTDEALLSYARALQLQPQDANIIDAIKRVSLARTKKKENDEKIPWLSACIGLILGVILVLIDYFIEDLNVPVNPILQVTFVLAVAAGGFGVGKTIVILMQKNIDSRLQAPESEESRKLQWILWLMGLSVGVGVVAYDHSVSGFISSMNLASRIGFAMVVALIGWGIGNLIQYHRRQKTEPVEEENAETPPPEDIPIQERTSNRYTRAQARYRYKKGKM